MVHGHCLVTLHLQLMKLECLIPLPILMQCHSCGDSEALGILPPPPTHVPNQL